MAVEVAYRSARSAATMPTSAPTAAGRDRRPTNLALALFRAGMQDFFLRRAIMIRPTKLGPIGGPNLGYTQEHEQERGLVFPCHNDRLSHTGVAVFKSQ